MQEDVYRGDGLNLYTYCRNNPVVYYDPSGMIGERTPGYNVYGLYDNDSEKPYYIGITNDLERRAQEHKETGRLDPKRQEYFENAYKNKLSQLEEGSTENVQCKDMGME